MTTMRDTMSREYTAAVENLWSVRWALKGDWGDVKGFHASVVVVNGYCGHWLASS